MSLKSRVMALADRFAKFAHEAGDTVWRSPSQAEAAKYIDDPYAGRAQVYDCGSAKSMPFELGGPFLALGGVMAVGLGVLAGAAALSEYVLQPIWTAIFQ